MKYWKESDFIDGLNFWKGSAINSLSENEIFVFGANPEARFESLLR